MRTAVVLLASLLLTAGPACAEDADAFVAWLRENGVPLKSVEAGHGFDDMEPIRAMIGDARIVSLGEATHGTREIFQAKHRMLEFLVEEMGFTTFGIEASYPDCVAIDQYVRFGIGDPAAALHGQGFWTWDTEEVLELIEWMRAWNADPAHERTLRFHGFDMQVFAAAVDVALPYLREFDPESADDLAERLEPAMDAMFMDRHRGMSEDDRRALEDAADDLVIRIDRHGRDVVEPEARETWNTARQHAIVATQFLEMVESMNQASPSVGMREMMRLATSVGGTSAKLLDYLGRFDADGRDAAAPVLEALAENVQVLGESFRDMTPAERRAHVVVAETARDRLLARRPHYERRSSPEAFLRARAQANDVVAFLIACAELAEQPIEQVNVRDRAMAENVDWILAQEGPDARIVLWSHNGHATRRPAPPGAGSMGNELERRHGDDHVVFGFAFHDGSFQAIYRPADGVWDGRPGLREHRVGAPPAANVGAVFGRAGMPICVADLRTVPADGAAWRWLDAPHPMRSIGAIFTPEAAANFMYPVRLPDNYDAIIFIRSTTRARPLRRTREKFGMD